MSNAFWRFFPVLLLLGFTAALAHPAAAQDENPPDRVARLNYMQGSISYQVSGDQDWVQADPNRPLTTGDSLWADRDSRGEVHIESTAIRLSSETGISFLTLDDRTAQIQLAQGTIEVHLRRLAPGDDWEFDTPNVALTLTRSGEYLISTDPDNNTTTILVREGEVQATGGGNSWTLPAEQEYILSGTDQLTYDAQPLPGFDDFEAWCQNRDQIENDSVSAQYVSRDVDGYYELDNYGQWEPDADYGEVWFPTVAAGWAPYRMGHWVYIAPWGWTWVDDEPWGFAPFHYGRWCYLRSRWAWVPGPMVVRPVYAPALVGFVGGGGWGVSLSFGGGPAGVGWYPLGPRDVYVPAYRCSQRYVQNINITNTRVVNVTQVTNVYNDAVVNHDFRRVNYTYARDEHAVTVVNRDTFVNARTVSRGMIRVNSRQIERARVLEAHPVAPTRSSYLGANVRVSTARPAVPIARRPVVVRLNPAVANPNRGGYVYTNDSRVFNQPARRATPQQQQQPSREGFHPFEPPAGSNRTQAQPRPDQNRNAQPDYRPNGQPNYPGNQNQIYNQQQTANPNQRPNNWRVDNQQRTNEVRQPENRPNQNYNQQPNNRQNQNYNQQQQQRTFRYAPQPRARDNMYDVHPPLNRNQNQSRPPARTQAAPRPQPQHNSAPAHQQDSHGGGDRRRQWR
jgi:hypothetical protein